MLIRFEGLSGIAEIKVLPTIVENAIAHGEEILKEIASEQECQCFNCAAVDILTFFSNPPSKNENPRKVDQYLMGLVFIAIQAGAEPPQSPESFDIRARDIVAHFELDIEAEELRAFPIVINLMNGSQLPFMATADLSGADRIFAELEKSLPHPCMGCMINAVDEFLSDCRSKIYQDVIDYVALAHVIALQESMRKGKELMPQDIRVISLAEIQDGFRELDEQTESSETGSEGQVIH